jgi:tetratricopeptide (TPR) repeat protein
MGPEHRSPASSGSAASQGTAQQALALLQGAVCAHQQGRLAQARAGYEAVLRIDPHNFDALHLLGVVALQSKDLSRAVELIGRALTCNPGVALAHSNLGNALLELGRPREAVAGYDRALALDPDYADAHYNRGVALLALHDAHAAIASFDAVIARQPAYVMAHFNRGVAHDMLGERARAVADYERVLALQPGHADALCNRGNALAALGRWEEALSSYEAALARAPLHPRMHLNRARALQQLKRHAEALSDFEHALSLLPHDVDALVGHGESLLALGRAPQALEVLERALTLQQDHPAALFQSGKAFMELKRWGEAVQRLRRAADLLPGQAQAHITLACALRRDGRWDEALHHCERALALEPQRAQVHYNLGNLLLDRLRVDEALACYEQAVRLQPDHVDAQWNVALCHLLAGRLEQGWPGYEWRWKRTGVALSRRERDAPLWTGETDVRGKTVLLHAEQGLGDTLQFCRYAPLLAQRGARVLLEVPAVLRDLLASLQGVHQVIAEGEALPPFDLHCPLLSLPLAFGTRLDTIPAAPAYLRAPPATQREWRQRLGEPRRARLGLVWAGNPDHGNDHRRSLPLRRLLQALPEGVDAFSLQKDLRPGDAELLAANEGIVPLGEALQTFADTAAALEQMDLLVCVDTSVAHLGAALGLPTWVLLPYAPDWRWLTDRCDSPWYPSMTLYRQTEPERWEGVLDRLAKDLRAWCDAETQAGERPSP